MSPATVRSPAPMASSRSALCSVIAHAERIFCREESRICEERAAERAAHTSSLKWTRLFGEPGDPGRGHRWRGAGPRVAQRTPVDRYRAGGAGILFRDTETSATTRREHTRLLQSRVQWTGWLRVVATRAGLLAAREVGCSCLIRPHALMPAP
jgi:hypothetical protein